MVGITYVYIDTIFAFDWYILNKFLLYKHLYCFIGCLSMVFWTHAIL